MHVACRVRQVAEEHVCATSAYNPSIAIVHHHSITAFATESCSTLGFVAARTEHHYRRDQNTERALPRRWPFQQAAAFPKCFVRQSKEVKAIHAESCVRMIKTGCGNDYTSLPFLIVFQKKNKEGLSCFCFFC